MINRLETTQARINTMDSEEALAAHLDLLLLSMDVLHIHEIVLNRFSALAVPA